MTKSAVFRMFKSDVEAEVSGIDVPLQPNDDNTVPAFRVGRMHARANPRYAKAAEQHQRPVARELELGVLDNETARDVNVKIFVDGVLLGWQHVQDEDGSTIPYTRDNAIKLMTGLPELRDHLEYQARNFENFRQYKREHEAKN